MKAFRKKQLAYAAAFALLFGGPAGADSITGPVTSSDQITTDDTTYTITSGSTSQGAIEARNNTAINIGGDDTESITVESTGYIGVVAYDNQNDSAKAEVTLTAKKGSISVTGHTGEGSGENSSGINASTYTSDSDNAHVTSNVTLDAGGNNVVTGGGTSSGISVSAYTRFSNVIQNGATSSSAVKLKAGGDNEVTGGDYGINALAQVSVDNTNLPEEGSTAYAEATSSVTLDAGQDNKVTGDNYGISAVATTAGSGATSESDSNATTTVELIADRANIITATEKRDLSTLGADEHGYAAIYAYAHSNYTGSSEATSTVTLTAEGDEGYNEVTGGNYGIYAFTFAYSGHDVESEVTLKAAQDNYVKGDDYGISAVSHASAIDDVDERTLHGEAKAITTVTLTAEQGSNYVTGGGYEGIYSYARGDADAESTVTLSAKQGNNEVAGYYGISSVADAGISTYEDEGEITTAYGDVMSIVELTAGGYNKVTGAEYGIYAFADVEAGTEAESIVTLTAGGNNEVTGGAYGIYAQTGGNAEVESTVTLEAGGTNIITATADEGVAVYAAGFGAGVGVTGAAQLSAATGAWAESGGTITFNDTVTTNAATAAAATGTYADSDGNTAATSAITFNDGLVTTAASALTAAEGGAVYVYDKSGSTKYTGTASVDADSTIYMQFLSSSAWYLTGDSTATTLSNSGLLDMTADEGAFSTLTLTNLTGTGGTIHMDIDASTNTENSDRIYITGTHDGTHYITLNNVNSDDITEGADGTVLVSVYDEQGEFKANDSEGTLYWERYTLAQQDSGTEGYNTDWYLAAVTNVDPDEKETTTIGTEMAASSLNYHTWMMQNIKMLQRLGDLRLGAHDKDEGVWFRVSGSKLSYGGEHGFGNKYMEYQAGYDKIIDQTEEKTTYGGIAFTYADGDSSYRRGSGNNEGYAASLYYTQIRDSGSYLDLVFKLGRWKNDFTVYDTNRNRITGETESAGISFSAELGKKIALNENGFYIEPQAQLTYGHLVGDTYTLSNGVNVHAEGIDSLAGRAGFNLGWDINPRSNIYLKANVYNEFLGDYGITLTDSTGRIHRSGDYGDTWFTYGLGGTFQLGNPKNGTYLYFDIERSTGGDLRQDWFYNVGFRFSV